MKSRSLLRLSSARAVVQVMLLAAPGAFGQTHVSTPLPTPAISFEVSTVKVNKSGSGGSHSGMKDGLFLASNISLKNLMMYQAYGVPDRRIVDAPRWMEDSRFDIVAKMDGATAESLAKMSRAERRVLMQGMFQRLLEDRFKLAVHREPREQPVYELVVAKGGAKLTAAKKPDDGMGTSAGRGMFQATSAKGADIAWGLTQEVGGELGRDVVDQTGLTGKYDIDLKWTPADDAQTAEGPSIFTAMQEQLGLRLVSGKAQIEVVVIDHVERPSEN